MSSIITVKDMCLWYGEHQALHNVNMERDIESRCMKLLTHRQSVARDLRLISAALKMITDMERIGDHATNIAEWVIYSVTGAYKEA